MKTQKFTLPAYWASYLINGDDSGMTETDREQCAKFLAKEQLNCHNFVDCGEQHFSSHNDAWTGLGGDVCEFTYISR